MENAEILAILKSKKKGQYATITKKGEIKNGKEVAFTKITRMNVRIGVKYGNMKCNSGKVVGSLPWGEWEKGLENLVITHKGNYYLRIEQVDDDGVRVLETKYFDLNGNEVSKEQVLAVVGKDKPLASKQSSVYNVKFDNIIKMV